MNSGPRCIDTGYWLALVDRQDQHHRRASELAITITGTFVTTDAVLLELGNALAGLRWRERSTALLARIRSTPAIDVVPVTRELFDRAVGLYTARPDKDWGLTDCVSFVVMQDRGITEALAADHHFVQAGFRALLLEE